ncbi:MAG: MATE family efflux transporter [Gammaproteobacteria bacterium]|nr:MATE family efflux transporter [Gammaproteobacteria bacterium]MDH5303600.1 MATE family efflux transporter [Gammaproteobacteria bacterium]MDH5322813.1 MATE family efflux transporter [Gammaproteobacteria bacterium]
MSGPVLPKDRDVWRIAAPMILSNVSVPLLGMVDTGVTGHLGSATYLGAVAIGGTVFGFLYTGMNFLRMGTTGIAAQQFGANDNEGLRSSLGQALIVALLIALALLAVQRPIAQIAMQLIGPEQQVKAFALQYFSIRIWSAPGTLANFVLIGWFIGLQNARVPLLIFLTVNVTNILLDLWFVLGLGMKVDGVALASLIAEYAGLAVAFFFAVRALRNRSGQWPLAQLFNVRSYAAFFAINANLLIRTMTLMFAFAFLTAQGARLGGVMLAANAVLMNLQHLTSFALDGIAHSAEALVGKAVGEKRRDALEHSVRLALKWSLIFAAGFCASYIVIGPMLIRVLTDLPDVRIAAREFLPWLIISPLISAWPFLYDGVYVGATRAREMRNLMLISTILVFVPAWYLLQGLGNHGLWLAFTLFMASRGIGLHLTYRRKVLPALELR